MDEKITIPNLLHLVNQVTNKYNDIAKITGERFNIFEVLKLQTNEIKHSAFIADLLDNKGRHGMGDKFLILFLEQVKTKFAEPCDYIKALEILILKIVYPELNIP